MKKIAVIGAGVNGLSVACRAAENLYNQAQVTLISDEMSPNTTGDGSAGLWGPFLLNDTPDEKIVQWSKDTHDFFRDLWIQGLAKDCGVTLIPCMRLTTDPKGYEDPCWRNVVFGYTNLNEQQLNNIRMEHGKNYTGGAQFITFTCEPVALLPYLYKRFEHAGGKFERRKIFKIDDLASEHYDLVINCTGLSSKYLVDDNDVRPIRGQVARVKAPWVFHTIMDDSDDGNYVIPNQDTVVAGGTHQTDDYNTNFDPNDTEFILVGCAKLIPSIKNAPVIREWVGLRPGRSSIRLELDDYVTKNGQKIPMVQNYGHGGSGVTLCWGCAADVLNLVRKKLALQHATREHSKL